MNEIERMFNRVGLLGIAEQDPKTYQIIGIKPMDFTAEKQLLLIQWLAKTRPIHINFYIDKWVIEGMVRYGKRYDTFEDALSGYINQIWQDLTEEEKQQIKEILE